MGISVGDLSDEEAAAEDQEVSTGTIDTMNDGFYCHLHLSAGNERGQVFGGHLNRAVVSATCEMVIRLIDGKIDRKYDDVTGLNLFHFA